MTDKTSEQYWKTELARPAIVAVLGGQPANDPTASWFGRVVVGAKGETWPSYRGQPLAPICQINLTECRDRPAPLDGIALLAAFVTPDFAYIEDFHAEEPMESEGIGWCVRSYASLDDLVPLTAPELDRCPRPFPISFGKAVDDYPTHDLLPDDMPENLKDRYYELGWEQNRVNTKLGGWPSCCQSEPCWDYAPGMQGFEFAWQIASEPKAQWSWGDGGVVCFGRHKTQRNRWAFDWQCF
ncbi:DUF1963 domain-containing protein [Pelagibius sp.]|uniref:DUF1963 domain-containing protein n=1 Tax=Pelagibius sp. TaxID=1931238 RepID=UPI0026315676|nr:DUF1963 domain-containing protein [Pelagibius sp.]